MAPVRDLGSILAGLFIASCACAGPAAPGGLGDSCFRAADCQPGLVCLMAQCTNDVGDAVTMVDGPDPVIEPTADGGVVAGAGGAGGAGGASGAAGAGGAAGAAGAAGDVGGSGAAGAAGAAGTAGAAGSGGAAGAGGTGGAAGAAGTAGVAGAPDADAGMADGG